MTTTGAISHGEIQPITPRKSRAKGRSISAVTVPEAMKSRTCSKPRRLAANEPTEAGRFSRRMPSTRSISVAEICTSIRALASSTKWLRSSLMNRSLPSTRTTPMASTHRVSVAWLGTTRSYTFIEKMG